MIRRIEFNLKARTEFESASNWYAGRSRRAAIGFVLAFEHALHAISEDPSRYRKTLAGCRRYSLSRDPYSVIFDFDSERVIVIAVAHLKRRPGFWKHRGRVAEPKSGTD